MLKEWRRFWNDFDFVILKEWRRFWNNLNFVVLNEWRRNHVRGVRGEFGIATQTEWLRSK